MANKFFAAIRARFFSSASDTAIDVGVNGDTNPRVAIDAGGRITWGDGSGSGYTAKGQTLLRQTMPLKQRHYLLTELNLIQPVP